MTDQRYGSVVKNSVKVFPTVFPRGRCYVKKYEKISFISETIHSYHGIPIETYAIFNYVNSNNLY